LQFAFLFSFCQAFPFGPGSCGGPNGFVALNGSVSPHSIPTFSGTKVNYWVLSGVPQTYVPGKTYALWINGSQASATVTAFGCPQNQIAGYMVVAMDANGFGRGTWATTKLTQTINCASTVIPGVYTASTNEYDPTNVHFKVTGGVAAGHTLAFNNGNPPTLFNCNWTAPNPGVGPITFTGIATVDPFDAWVLPQLISNGPGAVTTAAVPTAVNPPTQAVAPLAAAATGAGGATTALTTGQVVGISLGVVLGVLFVAVFVFPVVWAATHKEDPRVKRFTQTVSRGFQRKN